MVDEELNPRTDVIADVAAVGNYRSRKYLATPRVTQAVRRQFNCTKTRGVELENDGTSGSMGSHWEKRVFFDETMNAQAARQKTKTKLRLGLCDARS